MIAGLRPYPENRATAHAWLGAVPRHWSVVPNRALFSEVKDRNHPDEEMLSVTITRGIVRQKALLAASSKKDSSNLDKSAYKLVQPRDIAYNKMRAWQGAIGASALRGIISPAYVVMRLREDDNLPSYFHHLYRTPQFAKEAERWSYGITSDMWSLRPEHFKMIYTPQPPPEEQSAIVRFLDWANGRLERAIRAKRKVIALLNEQKQAIIHRAVTRGLDPSVPLKPSGIPWLGDIPQHWKVQRLGRLAKVFNGTTPSRAVPAYWSNGNIPWLASGKVNDRLVTTPTELIASHALSECGLTLVPSGALIMGLVGQGRTRGMCALLAIDACINQNLAAIVTKPTLLNQFLYYTLVTCYNDVREFGRGGNQAALNCEIVGRLPLHVPPIEEQQTICRLIQEDTRSLSTAISRLEREIELLREYRTRLVADVVTGKLDVREAAARLPDEAAPDTAEDNIDLSDETEPADEEATV